MSLLVRRRIGVALWVVGLLVAAFMAFADQSSVEARGIGFAPAVQISAAEPGRLAQLAVPLHAEVRAGDIVARLDAAPLLEERAVIHARLLAAQEQVQLDADNDIRRLAEGFSRIMADRVSLQIQLGEDMAEADALRERWEVEDALFRKGAVGEQAVLEWERKLRVVEARIREGRRALALTSEAELLAQDRSATRLAPEVWGAVVVESRELDRVEARIARTDLRAERAGQVTWFHKQPGEVVVPGDPIFDVHPLATDEVLAWVHHDRVRTLHPGSAARVRRSSGQVVAGSLVSVGVGPRLMPEALWFNPQRPEYGVPVRIALQGEVAPDEPVVVSL